MAKKAKLIVPVPADTVVANDHLTRIGELQRSMDALESDFATQAAALRERTDALLEPLKAEFTLLTLGLQRFAETKRDLLLPKGQKTVQLGAGKFGWRLSPPRVALVQGRMSKARLLEKIKAAGAELAKKYIRTKEEPNKQALLSDQPPIAGVTYRQQEVFFVEPKVDIVSARVAVTESAA